MGRQRVRSLTFDAGALIALDGGNRSLAVLLQRAIDRGSLIFIPAGVLAQVWRDGSRQARLSAFLADEAVRIEDLSHAQAKAIGELCGRRRTSDVVDASVVLTARRYVSVVLTSDPSDLLHLDPKLDVERI